MSSTSHFPNSPTARRANGERKAGVTDHGGAPQHGVAQEASDGQTHDRMVHHPTTQLLRLMFVLLWRCRTITFQIQFCSLKKMAIILLKKITKINYIHTWGLTLVTVSEWAVLRWLCFLIVWTLKAFLVLQVLEQSGHWWQKPLICVSTCSFTVYLQVKKKTDLYICNHHHHLHHIEHNSHANVFHCIIMLIKMYNFHTSAYYCSGIEHTAKLFCQAQGHKRTPLAEPLAWNKNVSTFEEDKENQNIFLKGSTKLTCSALSHFHCCLAQAPVGDLVFWELLLKSSRNLFASWRDCLPFALDWRLTAVGYNQLLGDCIRFLEDCNQFLENCCLFLGGCSQVAKD